MKGSRTQKLNTDRLRSRSGQHGSRPRITHSYKRTTVTYAPLKLFHFLTTYTSTTWLFMVSLLHNDVFVIARVCFFIVTPKMLKREAVHDKLPSPLLLHFIELIFSVQYSLIGVENDWSLHTGQAGHIRCLLQRVCDKEWPQQVCLITIYSKVM